MPHITRRKTHQVQIDHITVGSDFPVVVQSMTNTDTADAIATANQVKELSDAGSELVRITVNSPEAASKVAEIRQRLDDMGCATPLVGDFHFNGERLLAEFPDCAKALSKYRINPGNVGKGAKGDEKFAYMIRIATEHNKAVRIGVNERKPMVCKISCPTITSCVRDELGSGVKEMRIVSPMPSCSNTDSAAVEATIPLLPIPASVKPK